MSSVPNYESDSSSTSGASEADKDGKNPLRGLGVGPTATMDVGGDVARRVMQRLGVNEPRYHARIHLSEIPAWERTLPARRPGESDVEKARQGLLDDVPSGLWNRDQVWKGVGDLDMDKSFDLDQDLREMGWGSVAERAPQKIHLDPSSSTSRGALMSHPSHASSFSSFSSSVMSRVGGGGGMTTRMTVVSRGRGRGVASRDGGSGSGSGGELPPLEMRAKKKGGPVIRGSRGKQPGSRHHVGKNKSVKKEKDVDEAEGEGEEEKGGKEGRRGGMFAGRRSAGEGLLQGGGRSAVMQRFMAQQESSASMTQSLMGKR